MTDNFSETLKRRIFSAETAPVISKKYARFPEVETQIETVLRLSEGEFFEHLAINNRASEKFLREETLVCLLSLAHRENLFDIEDRIAERLFPICEKRIRANLKNQSVDRNFIEEAVGDLRLQMLEQFFNRRHESYDFWEARFYKALKALMFAYLRKHSGRHRATRLFSELDGEDGETNYAERLESPQDFAGDLETATTGRKILEKMPEDLRKIFIFYYLDDETQKTIAERLGATDRTVRNKLEKIGEFLSEWRARDGEKK